MASDCWSLKDRTRHACGSAHACTILVLSVTATVKTTCRANQAFAVVLLCSVLCCSAAFVEPLQDIIETYFKVTSATMRDAGAVDM
ncbi:hypothetical protein WJX77_000471 [Trebouxia sp. C0004]